MVSTSSNAGEVFLVAQRIDDHAPVGRVGTAMLRDGTVFVSWIERSSDGVGGDVWLRRISVTGELSVPVVLASAPSARGLGVPRIVVLKDYDDRSAEMLLAYTLGEKNETQVVTRCLTLPRLETYADTTKPCNCPASPDAAAMAAVHGRIISIDTENQSLRLRHDEVPGVLPAEETVLSVSADELGHLQEKQEIVGSLEQRPEGWRLLDVRVLKRSD